LTTRSSRSTPTSRASGRLHAIVVSFVRSCNSS
jgi:hypothetical protein